MKYNYHTHTYRCGHAYGEDEEYVISAIEQGYEILGFSDHAMFPNMKDEKGMRGNYEELEGYISSINNLKEKYKDKINILLGMECEYFDCFHDYLLSLLKEKKMDYLIFGNHFLKFEDGHIFNNPHIYTTDDYIIEYTKHAIKALDSGLFTIFAHPDLVMGSCRIFNKTWEECSYKLCEAAKRNNVYLEINEAGIRKGKSFYGNEERYPYPYIEFWKIAKKVGNKVVIGVDAHTPEQLKSNSHELALDFAKKLKIKIEENVVLKKGF